MDLRKTLIDAHTALAAARIEAMTIEEYFQFLEQYWQMFEPPKKPKKPIDYKIVLL